MSRVLVCYGTWGGSTRSIAETVAETLANAGHQVDLIEASEAEDPEHYDLVVIGTAVHAGKLHGNIIKYVRRNAAALTSVKVACFVVCMTMKDATEEAACTARTYANALLEAAGGVQPVSIGLFPGAILTTGPEFQRMGFLMKMMHKMMGRLGDHRDFDMVVEWAENLQAHLGTE